MRTTTFRTLASIGLLVVLGAPHATSPQTCSNAAARTLFGGGLADGLLNPPGQEDNQFFTSQGGFPNIFFLMDTSGSMVRLPPNGPPNSMQGALPDTTFVGCGTDPEFGGTATSPGFKAGTVLDSVNGRVYHSPCGSTNWENQPYQGHNTLVTGVDYALQGAICPHYTPSNTFQTGDPGYDPDFYNDNDNLTSGGGNPNLFPKNFVFHDSLYGDSADGWDFTSVSPWQSGNASGSIAQFCAAQGTTSQNGTTRQDICNSCLTKRGWFYDGTSRTWNAEFGSVKIPTIWYTGNYLNFYPPKFVIARRVVKDVIAQQTRIRMALGKFGTNGYDLVRDFNPSCQSVFGNGNWDSNRSTYVNDVNALDWGGGTPLSMALFDVGRYYHTPALPWFGTSWEDSSKESASSANQLAVCWSCQTSSVIVLTDGVPSNNDGNSLPNKSSATPAAPCASIADSNSGKKAGDYSTCILTPSSADCPKCYDFAGTDADMNNLTKVAFYLHNYDLRSEGAGSCGGTGGTLDGQGMPGKQVLDIYTVGFGTSAVDKANRILENTAAAGGGLAIKADSADQLKQGIFKVFTEINERSTSFSVATVSTLQTTTGHSVIVPRFDPSRDPHWAGHLYRFELYSEFVNQCTPNGVGDLDCDGACGSVFLTDRTGAFIAEDGNGHFIRTDGRPLCAQAPMCGTACGSFANPPVAASPWWDAYEALQQMSWNQRAVWTVVDSAAPLGVLTQADNMIRLEPTDSAAAAIRPYLGLGTSSGICANIASKISMAGDTVTAAAVASDKLECTKTIIRFVLGADVFNEMGRTPAQGWPPPLPDGTQPASATNRPQQDQLLDRKFKLGDIYHSSPVVVDAPLPADGVLCPNGLHNQCTESLWRTPIKSSVAGTNQYDLYSKSTAYQNRRKITLVGANDGMLHAFNAGRWHPGADDPVTTGVDESVDPFDGYYDRGEEDGAVELWAFIPPDLLGKLTQLLVGEHQIFVDGTAMVRDVWVDGVANSLVPSFATAVDDLKDASEFHTVAVVGERRGGNHYFALDLTDATKLRSENGNAWPKPTFLWIYPQPSSAESLGFGETYTDFLPVPPPIGPVRIKADSNSGIPGANTPTMMVDGVVNPVPYHERWITMLPGGFDPQGLRGRGVHMVDVWTGKELFDFSYPTGLVSSSDPRLALDFPIAATPAMVMWGKSVRRPSLSFENDGYFDTATVGDTGGQLWVLRFNTPGELDTSGMVQNWFGGRIFQMGTGASTGSLCNTRGGNPFFYITANTALPGSHVYRVFAGTGDRFNLLDTNGGTCGPDNLRACAQKGCSVTLDAAKNTFTATGLGSDARGLSQSACASGAQSDFSSTLSLAGSPPTCGLQANAGVSVSACPNALGGNAFTKDVAVTCLPDADGDYGCYAGNSVDRVAGVPNQGTSIAQTPAFSSYPQSRNWYFSLRVFDDTGSRAIFTTAAQATTYDQARYWLSDNTTSVDPFGASVSPATPPFTIWDGASTTGTAATATSPGWAVYYRHGPTITTEGHTYQVNLLDERTSSVSAIYGKVLWNTIQAPLGEATATTAGCAQSKCTASFRRLSYHYAADAVSGAPAITDSSGNIVRSLVQNTLVPAQGDQPTVFVNQKGQIAVGLTAVNPEKGASNVGMGGAMDPVMGLGATEIGRDLHACRHFKAAAPDGTLTAAERTALTAACK